MRALLQTGKRNQLLHRQRGFSLIELLIVVAVILIIAAIAIPNLLHAKIAANEAAAAEVIRTITTASVTYSSTYGNGYPATLANLDGPPGGVSTCDLSVLMDSIIAVAPNRKSGFTFAYTAVGTPVTAVPGCTLPGSNAYLVTATPISEFVTGIRSFCRDEPGTLHCDTTGAAAGSPNACETLPALIHNSSPSSSISLRPYFPRFHSITFAFVPLPSPNSTVSVADTSQK
jgi:type IV pilus assembly protein PilA